MESTTSTSGSSESAGASVHPELFTRQASGLVREMGLRDAFALNITIVSPLFFFASYAVFFGGFPHADLVIPIFLAAFASVFLGAVYGQLVATMPRSGGDYVFLSRITHPAIGSLAGGAMIVVFALSGGLSAIAWSQVLIPYCFRALGSAFSSPALTSFATTVSGKNATFISAIVMLLFSGVLAAAGVRIASRVIFYVIALGVLALFILMGYNFFTTRTGFVGAFNHAAGPNAYAAIGHAASKAGFISNATLHDVLLMTPFMMLGYVGFTFAAYPGGEVKRAGKTVLSATLGALGLAALLFLCLWLSLRHLVGVHFFRDAAFLNATDPSTYSKLSSVPPMGQEFALVIAKEPISKIIYGIAFPASQLVQATAYIFILSRAMFAMSFDRILPTKLADVNERTHTPIIAIAIGTIAMCGFAYIGTYTQGLATFFQNGVIIFIAVFLLASIAATLLPFLRRDLYEASPKLIGGQWLGLPPISVLGAVSTTAMAVLLFITLAHPQLSGAFTTSSILVLVVTFTIGLVAYVISRTYFRMRGVDLRLAVRELPPE
jgi:basic amino acid/polyamine antiporter, APA family